MITRISGVIRPKGSDLIFDHPYDAAEYVRTAPHETAHRSAAQIIRSSTLLVSVNGECDFDGSALTVREDDRKATVLKRLHIYEEETAPILSHYAEKASLLEVDGEKPKENIAQEIVMAIQSMLRISIAGAKNVQSTLEDNL